MSEARKRPEREREQQLLVATNDAEADRRVAKIRLYEPMREAIGCR